MQIRRYFYAEHGRIGTIARELGVHPDTVRQAIESDHFHRSMPLRPSMTDLCLEFVCQTLDQHPRLTATHWSPRVLLEQLAQAEAADGAGRPRSNARSSSAP
jgi:hypothetical protein